MYILYPFEKKRWCLCERDGGKSFENEKSFFNSWKIVRHCFCRQGLCCKTQGQTIAFKDDIYTLLPNDEQHTQMKPSKVPTSQKTSRNYFL